MDAGKVLLPQLGKEAIPTIPRRVDQESKLKKCVVCGHVDDVALSVRPRQPVVEEELLARERHDRGETRT